MDARILHKLQQATGRGGAETVRALTFGRTMQLETQVPISAVHKVTFRVRNHSRPNANLSGNGNFGGCVLGQTSIRGCKAAGTWETSPTQYGNAKLIIAFKSRFQHTIHSSPRSDFAVVSWG